MKSFISLILIFPMIANGLGNGFEGDRHEKPIVPTRNSTFDVNTAAEGYRLGMILANEHPDLVAKAIVYAQRMDEASQQFKANPTTAFDMYYMPGGITMTPAIAPKFFDAASDKINRDLNGFNLSQLPLTQAAGTLAGYAPGSFSKAVSAAIKTSTAVSFPGQAFLMPDPMTLPEQSAYVLDLVRNRSDIAPYIVKYFRDNFQITLTQPIKNNFKWMTIDTAFKTANDHDLLLGAQKKIDELETRQTELTKKYIAIKGQIANNDSPGKTLDLEEKAREIREGLNNIDAGFQSARAAFRLGHASPLDMQRLSDMQTITTCLYRAIADPSNKWMVANLYLTAAMTFISLVSSTQENNQWESLFKALQEISKQIDMLQKEMRQSFYLLDVNLAQRFYQVDTMLKMVLETQQGHTEQLNKFEGLVIQLQNSFSEKLKALSDQQTDVIITDCMRLPSAPSAGQIEAYKADIQRCYDKAQLIASSWSHSRLAVKAPLEMKTDLQVPQFQPSLNDFAQWTAAMAKIRGVENPNLPNPMSWSMGVRLFVNLARRFSQYVPVNTKDIQRLEWEGRALQTFYQSAILNKDKKLDQAFYGDLVDNYSKSIENLLAQLSYLMGPTLKPVRGVDQRLPLEDEKGNFVSGDAYPISTVQLSFCPAKERTLSGNFSDGKPYINGEHTYETLSEVGWAGDMVNLDPSILSLIPRSALWLHNQGQLPMHACIQQFDVRFHAPQDSRPNRLGDNFIFIGPGVSLDFNLQIAFYASTKAADFQPERGSEIDPKLKLTVLETSMHMDATCGDFQHQAKRFFPQFWYGGVPQCLPELKGIRGKLNLTFKPLPMDANQQKRIQELSEKVNSLGRAGALSIRESFTGNTKSALESAWYHYNLIAAFGGLNSRSYDEFERLYSLRAEPNKLMNPEETLTLVLGTNDVNGTKTAAEASAGLKAQVVTLKGEAERLKDLSSQVVPTAVDYDLNLLKGLKLRLNNR